MPSATVRVIGKLFSSSTGDPAVWWQSHVLLPFDHQFRGLMTHTFLFTDLFDSLCTMDNAVRAVISLDAISRVCPAVDSAGMAEDKV